MGITQNRELGRKIVKARGTRTQQEVATRAGLSVRHYARLENGENTATDRTLAKLADALGVPVESFRAAPRQDGAATETGQAA